MQKERVAASMKFPQGWATTPDGKRVSTTVKAHDFMDALDLFAEIGEVAEELEHHPDLHLESYDKVRIESYSHDVGKLTERDERLVERVDEILRERGLR
jgi:4a-hydroxytetrahydrobiopterin dehydratase